jgi:ubiquinone biosynthesis protein UbiJ
MQFDTTEYLENIFPSLLQRSPALLSPRAYTIQFLLIDERGGDVFYRVGGRELEVGKGISDEVDLTLAMSNEELKDLSLNQLDAGTALRSGRLKVFGDRRVLLWLAEMLAKVS